jgi:hypothetical protein
MITDIQGHQQSGSKKTGAGTLFIYLILILIVMAAFIITGGSVPVDPHSTLGPSRLPPYYDIESENNQQKIILPPDALTPSSDKNLQLKTFLVNTCVKNVAVDFLIDTSGSFAYDGKLENLQNSLRAFTKRMANMSVIGVQSFSAVVKERVPLDYYKNQKVQMEETIKKLSPGGNTRTRDGFLLAQKLIKEAKAAQKFKDYQYVLVLLTDGIPEVNPGQRRTCIGPQVADPLTAPALRCFAREQDPRYPTNIASQLKADNVRIFSIGIYSPNRPSDARLQPYLEDLLQDVASDPVSDYYYSSVHGGDLNQILDKVFLSICQ